MSKLEIVDVYSKDNKRYFVDNDGKTFHYNKENKQTLLNFNCQNSIKMIAVSYHFVVFLNNSGQLFSQGHNKKGELGLGVTSKREIL